MKLQTISYLLVGSAVGLLLAGASSGDLRPAFAATVNPRPVVPEPSFADPKCEEPSAQAFAIIRMEAVTIADLTLSPAVSSASSPGTSDAVEELWDEIHARAMNMAELLEEATAREAMLTPFEREQAQAILPYVTQILTEAQATRLTLASRDADAGSLTLKQDAVGRAAGAIMDLLAHAPECAPHEGVPAQPEWEPLSRCETLDPAYQQAMHGDCLH